MRKRPLSVHRPARTNGCAAFRRGRPIKKTAGRTEDGPEESRSAAAGGEQTYPLSELDDLFAPLPGEDLGDGVLTWDDAGVALTGTGLLRVDQLLPAFYDPRYRNARYT